MITQRSPAIHTSAHRKRHLTLENLEYRLVLTSTIDALTAWN